jgi:hypothetical protein
MKFFVNGTLVYEADVTKLEYDERGLRIIDSTATPPTGENRRRLNRHLSIQDRPEDLFRGTPFVELSKVVSRRSESGILREITFRRSNGDPGLKAELIPGSVLAFGNNDNPYNAITIESGLIDLDKLYYSVDERYIEGLLRILSVTVRKGHLSTGGSNIILGSNSKLEATNGRFRRDESGVIELQLRGLLDASLTRGSLLQLNATSWIALSSGTASIRNFEIYSDEVRKDWSISWGNASTLECSIEAGELQISTNSALKLGATYFTASFSTGTWPSEDITNS